MGAGVVGAKLGILGLWVLNWDCWGHGCWGSGC